MKMREWREGWDRAAAAASTLAEAFRAAGATEGQVNRLRPTVSGKGTPWVDVGMVPASLAVRIAEAMRAGTALEAVGTETPARSGLRA
ncbi:MULTISPECIES: hypothetical protein [unclassified Streptomyces]|uniref:Uncharacterized protein n=1 Tax=Streptomyces sp. NBC_00060 TaxID=2975636 RepID=A0AAU2H3R8_9ACTN